jgi:hypothetical protein
MRGRERERERESKKRLLILNISNLNLMIFFIFKPCFFLQITQYGRKVVWPVWNVQTTKEGSSFEQEVHHHHQNINTVRHQDLPRSTLNPSVFKHKIYKLKHIKWESCFQFQVGWFPIINNLKI